MQTDYRKLGITATLGIQGWRRIDALILAALATESPVLLIGGHGAAKTRVFELVAEVLNLSSRHYNASLLNYDDLVGIPVPEDGNARRLKFISTDDSIWEAEFVLFDEISRCRADLQNKMFPIIYERRVSGVPLKKLKHRWAAMNPPTPDDPDLNSSEDYYIGSEQLDTALIDRFPFIIRVPSWSQMSKDEKRKIVSPFTQKPTLSILETWLSEMIAECAALIPELETDLHDWLCDYTTNAVDLLIQAKLGQSARRAHMLARSVVAVHAARMVLEGMDIDLEDSAELALIHCLPQTATDVPPSTSVVRAIHRQAWEIAGLSEDDAWRTVLEELDATHRVIKADQLGMSDADVSRLITQALAAPNSDARRIGLAAIMTIAFQQRRDLTPAAWESLIKLAGKVLEPRSLNIPLRPGAITDLWTDINNWLPATEDTNSIRQRLERNFVLNGFPELWQKYDWRTALDDLRADMDLFAFEQGDPS